MASDIASPPPKLPAALVPMYIYLASSIIAFFSWLGGVRDAYRFDPFFRTEANIISLHFAFAGLVLVILGISFGSTSAALRRDIETGVAQTLSSNDQSIIVESVATAIAQGRTQKFLLTVVLIIGATFLFTFVIVRASLTPARNALASQKQFIGNIAHELRTPLSIIKTNAEVSLFESDISPLIRRSLKECITELDRASEILNNLLSLSTLLRPEQIQLGPVDMAGILDRVAHLYHSLARRSEVELTVEHVGTISVWGNTTAMQQIVGNLVKNAIQYSSKKGRVKIVATLTDRHTVELVVQDAGIGIARDDLYRIFEPFYRSEPSRNRSTGGSGLGLAIVSELVKMHHGKITIRSAPKKGTTVIVSLPAAPAPTTDGPASQPKDMNEVAADFSSRT